MLVKALGRGKDWTSNHFGARYGKVQANTVLCTFTIPGYLKERSLEARCHKSALEPLKSARNFSSSKAIILKAKRNL